MHRILHLSDVHYGADPIAQPQVFAGLLECLKGQAIDGIVYTGDIFDTSDAGSELVKGFLRLHSAIEHALGKATQTIIIPGNHDRRTDGVFAPYRLDLFDELRTAVSHRNDIAVTGGNPPFLAQRIEWPNFPADIVSYDSTWSPTGILAGGGYTRVEDILRFGSELIQGDQDRPLLFLVHHHLLPPPLTDTGPFPLWGQPPIQKFLLAKVLPWLLSGAEHDDITILARGAGSTLSTLQTLGRAVLVLHGHKHNPCVRLLCGTSDSQADILLSGAGSCGIPQDWFSGGFEESPTLWPSFDIVELDASDIRITNHAWSPFNPHSRPSRRTLFCASREGKRWVRKIDEPRTLKHPTIELNSLKATLLVNSPILGRLDVRVERQIQSRPRATQKSDWEVVDGPNGARVIDPSPGDLAIKNSKCPARIQIPYNERVSYCIESGARWSLIDAADSPFDCIELTNMHMSDEARLEMDVGPIQGGVFGTAMDLLTGIERPFPVSRDGSLVRLIYRQCPPRTILRLYWELERN